MGRVKITKTKRATPRKIKVLKTKDKILSRFGKKIPPFSIVYYYNNKIHNENDEPALIFNDGSKFWYNKNKLHRTDDKPAAEYADGTKEWWINGKLHREFDLPAIIDKNDMVWYKENKIHRDQHSDDKEEDRPAMITNDVKHWFIEGKEHRDFDLPAIITLQEKRWMKNGLLHRDQKASDKIGDRPAVLINVDGNISKIWFKDGKKHRDFDLPAVIDKDELKEWWMDGKLHREINPAVIMKSGKTEMWLNGRKIVKNLNVKECNMKEFEELFDCDMAWVILMNNREMIKDLQTTIIKESNAKNVEFRGACICGSLSSVDPETNLSNLIDAETIDLVSVELKENLTSRKQKVFNYFDQFLKKYPPRKNKLNIYFVGDAYGKEEYVSIHWNCFLLEDRKNVVKSPKLLIYDPSMSKEYETQVYNFNKEKRDIIVDNFDIKNKNKLEVLNIYTKYPSQNVCQDHCAMDVFCQSWIHMFVSAYVNDAFDGFALIDFTAYHSQPLKMWLKCITTRLPKDWTKTLEDKKYEYFLTKCRIPIDDKTGGVASLPPIIDKRSKKVIVPCIYSVITHYLDLGKLYNPRVSKEDNDDLVPPIVKLPAGFGFPLNFKN